MANGTSMAAPQVAGAAALLLSAAKAHSLTVSPAGLKTALTGTADPIPGVPAVAQGSRHHRHRRGLEAAQRHQHQ